MTALITIIAFFIGGGLGALAVALAAAASRDEVFRAGYAAGRKRREP